MVMIDLRKPPVLVLATNPWLSGKLLKAAKEAGVNIKKFWYFRNPPPWSRFREYRAGASEAQLKQWERFAKVSREHRGEDVASRIIAMRRELARRAVEAVV